MTSDPVSSVRARLLNRARASGEEFERTLVRYAGERLLYRLGACPARDRCLLKGASLLSVWLHDPHRATRDVDLLAFGASDDASIAALVEQICAVACPEDGLHFDLAALRVESIRAEAEHDGRRATFFAYLGKARIRVQLDIGTGDATPTGYDEIEFPVLLDDLPAPRLRAYPPEATVAEKLEAIVKLGTRNSRMKDFHDIWALSGSLSFDGARLRRAIAGCFERRSTPLGPEIPRPLTPAFYRVDELERRWSAYARSRMILTPPPTRFAEIGERLVEFLGPVRAAIVEAGPFELRWVAGGP